MNVKRGLFRIWLVLSALFVIAAAVVSFDGIKSGFEQAALMERLKDDDTLMPVYCGKARGKAGTDYTTKENQTPGPWDTYAEPDALDTCYYMSVAAYRRQFPEFSTVSDEALIKKVYAEVGRPTRDVESPWVSLLRTLGWALGIPLVVLAIGSAIYWAFAGFARSAERW